MSAIARSFHGPLVSVSRISGSARSLYGITTARSVERGEAAPKLEAVPAPPSRGSVGRALLAAARAEQPTAADRERVLAAVLGALRVLTGGV